MSYKSTIIGKGTIICFSGKLSVDEFLKALRELMGGENFVSDSFRVWDFTEGDSSEIDIEDETSPFPFRLGSVTSSAAFKLAVVANDQRVVFLARRQFEELRKCGLNWDLKIFTSRTEALNWCEA